MHWCQSLASKGFGVRQVVEEVRRWKRDRERWKTEVEMEREMKRGRLMPSESEVRKAFEDDPKALGERKSYRNREKERDRIGDLYRPESSSRRDADPRERHRREDRERDSWSEMWEDSRQESPRSRKFDEQAKFDGPPPRNYVCNRCELPSMFSRPPRFASKFNFNQMP